MLPTNSNILLIKLKNLYSGNAGDGKRNNHRPAY